MKAPDGRFARLSAAAVFDRGLSAEAVRVLAALASYADRNGQCWPAVSTIAERLGVSRRAVQYTLRDLRAAGYLTIEPQVRARGGFGTSLYSLKFPPVHTSKLLADDVKPGCTSEPADDVKPHCTSSDPVTDPVTEPVSDLPMCNGASPPMCNPASRPMRSPASPKLAHTNYPTELAHTRAEAREAAGTVEIEGSAVVDRDPNADDPMMGDWLVWAAVDDCPPDNLTRMAGELYQALDHGLGNTQQRDMIGNFARTLNEGRMLSAPQANALRAIHDALSKAPDGLVAIANRTIRRRFPAWARLMGKGHISSDLIRAAKRRDVLAIERIIATHDGAR